MNGLDAIPNNYFDFHNYAKGKCIIRNGHILCKSEAFWGLKSRRIKKKELKLIDKPGWFDGEMNNHPRYILWLMETQF